MFEFTRSLRRLFWMTIHRATLTFLILIAALLVAVGSHAHSEANACDTPGFSPAPIYPVGSEPRHATVGDLNGDGKADIVTANYGSDSVSVLLNDGTGGFIGPTHFPAGNGSQSVAIGDFNSDGKPDLVTADVGVFTVSLLLGDGAGNFGAPTTFNAGGQAFFLVIGDFNNDNKLDIAVALGSKVSILLGNGSGGFAAPRLSANLQQPQFLATADFNGDGKLDLAVAAIGGLRILLGNAAGDFSASNCTPVSASNIVVADLNGDSKPDLVTTWNPSNQVSVLINNGAGCFAVTTFNDSSSTEGHHTAASQVTDLNHDGKLDLLIGTDFIGFSVFLGDGNGNFGPPLGRADGGVDLWGVADFNGDGNRDAVAITPLNSVSIYFGDGTGGFQNALDSRLVSSVAGDFNNDGRTDLAISSLRGCAIVLNNGGGGFETPRNFPLSPGPSVLAAGDFNNDNKLDLATIIYTGFSNVAILLGDGAGNLAAPLNSVTGGNVSSLGVADFNNDGKLDVVTGDSLNGKIYIKLGNGNGGFGPDVSFSQLIATNNSLFGIGDFNNDGKKDLAVPNFTGVSILLGNGMGSFGAANTAVPGIASQAATAFDLNADGKLDLVSANSNTNAVTLALGDGAGGFGVPKSVATDGRTVAFAVGEFNGDGLVDLAVANNSSAPNGLGLSNVGVLLNDGAGGLRLPTNFTIARPSSITAADFTSDGRTDIVTTSGNGTLARLINTCTSGPSSQTRLQFSAASYLVAEDAGSITITVTRTGDIAGESSVDYRSSDGSASQRSDYTLAAGTLRFAPGETSKPIEILVSDDLTPIESFESLGVSLTNPTGANLTTPSTVTINIADNDPIHPSTNPLDNSDARFFVRQHYNDFLSRAPDPGGLDYWSGQITLCGNDQRCIHNKKVEVSNAFFYEQEYQQTGSYVFYLYRAAFGNNQPFPNPDGSNLIESNKIPSYAAFVSDRARVIDSANLAQSQLALATAFVQRPQFLARYPASMDPTAFVNAILATIANGSGADLSSQRATLIALHNQEGRGAVLYRLANDNVQTNPVNNRAFIDVEYNRAFVFTEYAGYLRRDSDIGGFLFWLDQINRYPVRNPNIQHVMVCAFITSREYQQRFSPITPHSNSECG